MRVGEIQELARFKGSKLDRLEAKHAWLDRTSLIMNGDHVTLGEADAEVELDVRFESKGREEIRHGLCSYGSGPRCRRLCISVKIRARGLSLRSMPPADSLLEVEHFARRKHFRRQPEDRRISAGERSAAACRKVRPSLSALLAVQESSYLSRDAAVVRFDGRGRRPAEPAVPLRDESVGRDRKR